MRDTHDAARGAVGQVGRVSQSRMLLHRQEAQQGGDCEWETDTSLRQ